MGSPTPWINRLPVIRQSLLRIGPSSYHTIWWLEGPVFTRATPSSSIPFVPLHLPMDGWQGPLRSWAHLIPPSASHWCHLIHYHSLSIFGSKLNISDGCLPHSMPMCGRTFTLYDFCIDFNTSKTFCHCLDWQLMGLFYSVRLAIKNHLFFPV